MSYHLAEPKRSKHYYLWGSADIPIVNKLEKIKSISNNQKCHNYINIKHWVVQLVNLNLPGSSFANQKKDKYPLITIKSIINYLHSSEECQMKVWKNNTKTDRFRDFALQKSLGIFYQINAITSPFATMIKTYLPTKLAVTTLLTKVKESVRQLTERREAPHTLKITSGRVRQLFVTVSVTVQLDTDLPSFSAVNVIWPSRCC